MAQFGLVPGDMGAASAAAEGAADDARGADGSAALDELAAALPGTTTAEILPDLGAAWQAGVGDWADGVDALAVAIDDLTADTTATDGGASSMLTGLLDALGWRR